MCGEIDDCDCAQNAAMYSSDMFEPVMIISPD